ncbi:hypothetical protein [Rhodococcus koreensis]|uniref:hypothetical protein n=1 Tax=Rhodococcus koreensis TaxID=99653 RepID=UPI00366D99A0
MAASHSFQDADNLGSFAATVRPLCFRIHVQGYPSTFTDLRSARSERTPLPRNESEGWARAVLGKRWSDYAYQLVVVEPDPRLPDLPEHDVYVVFVDAAGVPVLAPDNTRWDSIWISHVQPRKLDPDLANTALIDRLSRSGPFVATDAIRDPRTEPDGCWKIEIVGDPPDALSDVARETFTRACRSLRIRGAVTSHFRTVRIELDGDLVRVYFQWTKNPNLFAMTFRLPTTADDFRGPPMDTPAGVVSTVLLDWMEELDTGLIVRGTRRRKNGVLHISAPAPSSGPARSDFGLGAVPLRDTSGTWLAAEGLHIDDAVDATNTGTPTVWVQAYKNNQQGRPFVGHAAARWTAPGVATFDVLETVPGTPDSVNQQLIREVTHALADAGAHEITTAFEHPELVALGYTTDTDRPRLDVTSMP